MTSPNRTIKSSKTSSTASPSNNNKIDSFDDVVYLIEFLQKDDTVNKNNNRTNDRIDSSECANDSQRSLTASSDSSGPISRSEIALLVLPWALQQLDGVQWETHKTTATKTAVRQQCTETDLPTTLPKMVSLLGQAISCCLIFLQQQQHRSGAWAKILSQSTLYKTVPKMGMLLLAEAERTSANHDADGPHTSGASSRPITATKSPLMIAYELLLEEHFHPTLEVAFKVVLLPLVSAVQASLDSCCVHTNNISLIQRSETVALISTLHWIRDIHLSRKGNPKTTFQLLTDPVVLNTLWSCHDLIERFGPDEDSAVIYVKSNQEQTPSLRIIPEILSVGLFHARHHMDGFVAILLSKNTKSIPPPKIRPVVDSKIDTIRDCEEENAMDTSPGKNNQMSPAETPVSKNTLVFKSYHEELLSTIENWNDASLNVQMLPMLLREFYQQSIEWERHQGEISSKALRGGSHTRKDKAGMVGLLQFRIFKRWTVNVLRTTAVCPASFRAVQEMLELLVEFDSFKLSHEDMDGGDEYTYLQLIATQVMKNIGLVGETASPAVVQRTVQDVSIPCAMRYWCALMKLHHSLVHDNIVDAMAASLVEGNTSDRIVEFFSAVVDTHRLLRQQSFIFASILKVVDTLKSTNALTELVTLHSLLKNSCLLTTLAVAMDTSPIVETSEIFVSLNSWFAKICQYDQVTGDDNGLKESMEVVLQLTTVASKNVRVDRSSSTEVAKQCRDFVNGAVYSLSERESTGDCCLNSAMSICGLFFDLHTRCVFWLGKNEVLAAPTKITVTLKAITTRVSSDNELFLEGAVFLSCHRLKHLHSLIYELERQAMTGAKKNSMIKIRTTEAVELAAFLANVSETALNSRKQRWLVVAQCFSSWISYASDEHTDSFLKWVILSASTAVEGISNTLVDVPHTTGPFAPTAECDVLDHFEIAKCLVLDSSFHQYPEVSSRMYSAGLSVVTGCILAAIGSENSSRDMAHLVSTLSQTPWKQSNRNELKRLASRSDHVEFELEAQGYLSIESALHSVLLINGMPCCSAQTDGLLKTLDMALRVDYVCRSLCFSNRSLSPTLTSISSSLRLLMIKFLKGDKWNSILNFLCAKTGLCELILGLLESATAASTLHDSFDATGSSGIVNATGRLVEQMLLLSFDNTVDVLTANALSTGFCQMRKCAKSTPEIRSHMCLARFLLKGLRFCDWHILYPIESETTAHLATLYDAIRRLALEFHAHSHDQNGRTNVPDIPADSTTPLDDLLLVGDTICFKEVTWLYTNGHIDELEDLQGKCIAFLNGSKTEPVSDFNISAVSYFVANLTHIRPNRELTKATVDALISLNLTENDGLLLDASFCHSVPYLLSADIEMILATLTKYTGSNSCTATIRTKIRLLKFLMRYLDEKDHIELLSAHGKRILLFSLKAMDGNAKNSSWAGDVLASSELLEELAKRREIFAFKEGDLALILSYIISSHSDLDATIGDSSRGMDVYRGTATLFITIFQRYTKQLYACAPAVILMLHSFLRHAMHAPESLSEQDIAQRGQWLARLCELLVGHKEIYKKYVIGLVLKFVVGLSASYCSLKRRESLIPAIFCLLDTMTKFEMQQLNAFMDTKAKIIYRSVHQNYEKSHAYKGQ